MSARAAVANLFTLSTEGIKDIHNNKLVIVRPGATIFFSFEVRRKSDLVSRLLTREAP